MATEEGKSNAIIHGGASIIEHDGKTIFEGLPSFNGGRYHSLGVLNKNVMSPLEVSASTPFPEGISSSDRLVMGIRHTAYPVEGVQFHPESVLTMEGEAGRKLIENVARLYT